MESINGLHRTRDLIAVSPSLCHYMHFLYILESLAEEKLGLPSDEWGC